MAVGVNEAKPIEGRVHHFAVLKNEIGDRRDCSNRRPGRQSDGDGVLMRDGFDSCPPHRLALRIGREESPIKEGVIKKQARNGIIVT